MNIRFNDLSKHLQGDIQPVYFLTGDEPFQMMQAKDMILAKTQAHGFVERDVYQLDGSSDWSELTVAAQELSLFAQQKVIDVRMTSTTPGRKGSAAIREYLTHVPDDKVLILQMPRLDKKTKNSAWVKALEKQASMVQIWDLSTAQTLSWASQQLRNAGLRPSDSAVQLLAERVEGNLLAAHQEIQKLVLLFGDNAEITEEHVMQSVVDSSRFSVFDLSDAVLMGDLKRINHILLILREEGVAFQLVLWSLSKLSRQLYEICQKMLQGIPANQAIGYVMPQKKGMYQNAGRRLMNKDWQHLLAYNYTIDRDSKGQAEVRIGDQGVLWNQVEEFAFALAR